MEKISYEVIGKDCYTNKDGEHTIVASGPVEAKLIASQKYPRFMVGVVYPTKFKYNLDYSTEQ